MILFLDIETTGLTGDIYQITCIATKTDEPDFTEVFFASKPSEELNLLILLKEQKIDRCNKIVVWRKLDIPFIQTRALLHNLEFPINVPIIDLASIVEDKLLFSQRRFKDMIAFLGIKREGNENFDGSQMPIFYTEYERGNLKRKDDIILHNKNDVENLAELYERLKRVGLVE